MFEFTVDYDRRRVHHIMEKIFKFLAALVKLLVLCSCSFPADTVCCYSDHLKLVDKTEGKFKKAHLFRVFSGCRGSCLFLTLHAGLFSCNRLFSDKL